MSWWTNFRDGLETAAAVVANYYYPGVGILGEMFNSKGSQEQLGSVLGQVAMLGSGIAGGAAGNMANYGTALDAASQGASSMFGSGSSALGTATDATGQLSLGPNVGGVNTIEQGATQGVYGGPDMVGTSTRGIDMAQNAIASGQSPALALQQAGISPSQAEAGGIQLPSGQTWMDVATQNNIPYSGGSGAAPTFSGQNMPGAAGSVGGGAMGGNAGMPGGSPFASATPAGAGGVGGSLGGAGSMPWGSPGNVSSMGSGMYGLMAAGQLNNLAQSASAQADPFGPYRKQYADQMAALSANPSLLTQQPGYQAGMQAVQRSMAAQGYTGSGNMMAALSKYGGDFYNQTMNQYAGLAGANVNPGTGAQLKYGGGVDAVQLAGQSLNRLGYGATMAGGWPGMGG